MTGSKAWACWALAMAAAPFSPSAARAAGDCPGAAWRAPVVVVTDPDTGTCRTLPAPSAYWDFYELNSPFDFSSWKSGTPQALQSQRLYDQLMRAADAPLADEMKAVAQADVALERSQATAEPEARRELLKKAAADCDAAFTRAQKAFGARSPEARELYDRLIKLDGALRAEAMKSKTRQRASDAADMESGLQGGAAAKGDALDSFYDGATRRPVKVNDSLPRRDE